MSDMLAGVGQIVGSIMSAHAANKARKGLQKLEGSDPVYESSPYAAKNLGMAQQLLNSRMAGAQSRENNIMTGGANIRSGINRNATDSSQALALMAGTQGQEQQGFNDLQLQEAQDAAQKQNNLIEANQGMTAEHQALYGDKVRRWQDQVNMVLAKHGQNQMVAQGVTGIFQGAANATRDRGGEAAMGAAQGAVSQAGGSILGGMLSDKRLKHSYHVVGKSKSGINIYHFCYNGSNDVYEGVMAQEVPQASFDIGNGILAVDYSKIDVQFKKVS